MTLTVGQAVASIAVMAVMTFLTRYLPFLLFDRKGDPPKIVLYLGRVLPPAIIMMLIIYCLRNVSFLSGSHGIPELVCIAVAAALHWWKGNNLLSIFTATVLYMFLVQVVFV
ncbi:MAG: branched-chain amino acid transporter permease [Oscillospiraceae bacterium]